MATLDRVMQMQSSGMTDPQITATLQQEGVSATEINNAINQAKVKNAVSPNMPEAPDANMPAPAAPEAPMPAAPQAQAMPGQDPYGLTTQAPAAQDQYAPQMQDPYAGQDYYQQTPQAYSDQGYGYEGGGGASTENVSEIAEQVVEQKLNEYKQKVGDIASFKNTATDKINDIDDRLKRIESSIDKLQQAVIGKIGEFGESTGMIHKDMENLHDTMGKLMNPLVDTYNELKKK